MFHLFPFQSAQHIVEGKAEMTEAEKVIMDGHSVLEPLITKHADVEQKLGGDSDISTEHVTDIVEDWMEIAFLVKSLESCRGPDIVRSSPTTLRATMV